MSRHTRLRIVAALLVLLVLAPVPFACGPFFENPVFTDSYQPDHVEAFAGGELGIVHPTFHRVYLYFAYRHLKGLPFSATELAATLKNYRPDPEGRLGAKPEAAQNWVNQWRSLENKVLGLAQPPLSEWQAADGFSRAVPGNRYQTFLNCPLDAFRNALATYREREQKYDTAELKEWVATQRAVFANCGDYPNQPREPVIPTAVSPESGTLFREDRAYQIAAARFYAGQFDEAARLFDAIASEKVSPWSKIAPYLAARAIVRKATLTVGEGAFDAGLLAQAQARLSTLLGNSERRESYRTAQSLLNFVRFRLEPELRRHELAKDLQSSVATANRSQDLIDYTRILDRSSEKAVESQTNTSGTKITLLKPDPMTDWILTFQSRSEQALNYSLERWSKEKSPAWLLASVSKLKPGHPRQADVLAATETVSSSSAMYLTVTYHRARLLAGSGKSEEARAILARVLESPDKRLDRSSANAFKALRMRLARNLGELLKDAARIPIPAAPARPERFDVDGAQILTERLPLKALVEAAEGSTLPAHPRRQVAVSAWTRAVLLGQHEVAGRLSIALGRLAPELQSDLAQYGRETNAAGRTFAAALLLLRNPGMRPFVSASESRELAGYGQTSRGLATLDRLRDNWWCSLAPSKEEGERHYNYYRIFLNLSPQLAEIYPSGELSLSAFPVERDKPLAQEEWQTLQRLPGAPSILGKIVLDYAQEHSNDIRLPEALHRVVRATRYGCTDAQSGKYSKAAFELLHKQYAKSEWTKKTPLWFNW